MQVQVLACGRTQVHTQVCVPLCAFNTHLSPSSTLEGLGAATPQQQYAHVAAALSL